MKKFAILAAVVALIGCAQNDEGLDNITNNPEKSQTEFYASMPECDTRTYVEDNRYLRWNADDEITVFAGNSYNGHWQFAGDDGAHSGKFNEIGEGGFVTGTPLDLTANYAIYPYDENITITEAGVVALTLPAVQEYNHAYANSFGAGANTMMAVTKNTSDNFLAFKNLCGYLKLKFYGNDVTVKSITVKGNNGEKIAGKATVSMAYGGEPTITMGDDATDTITIDCGEGVALSNDAANPTTFWVVIPEITFEGGITIEVTDINGQTFTKQTTNAVPIENNLIQPMAALEVEVVPAGPANNEIWYTATEQITPYATNVFGANIISNEWDETTGEGVITFDGKVTKIGDSAFYNGRGLNRIYIPDGVSNIGSYAFDGCKNMQYISIPNSVVSFGELVFQRCTGELFLNCNVPDQIGTTNASFADSQFSKITFGEKVSSIGRQAFSGLDNLTDVIMSNNVTSIGLSAFAGCTKLCNIKLSNNIVELGDGVFSQCDQLPIENNIQYADTYAVGVTDSKLKNIELKDGTIYVGSKCFENMYYIENITLPNSIKIIGSYAFASCSRLTNVIMSEGVISIGARAFEDCTSIEYITIPNSVQFIRGYAFHGCSSLSRISLGNAITTIGYSAFVGCGALDSIIIPESVKELGLGALSCSLLQATFKSVIPPKLDTHLFGDYKLSAIYVPQESVNAYKTADVWSKYAELIEPYDLE